MSLKTTPTPDDKNPLDPEIVHADAPGPQGKLGCPQEAPKPEPTRKEQAEVLRHQLINLINEAHDHIMVKDLTKAYFTIGKARDLESKIYELEKFATDEDHRQWLLNQVAKGFH